MGGDAGEMVGGLLTMVACGIVLAVAGLLVVYKMIDGDVPVPAGSATLCMIVGVLAISARPPHPAIPAIVLVVALTLMAFFPFALNQMDKADLLSHDVDQLEKSYSSLSLRPDNFASRLELAKSLRSQGFIHHAIAIATATLDTIPSEKDIVSNRSLRDQFQGEDYKVRQWMREAVSFQLYSEQLRCRSCNFQNELTAIMCAQCGQPYLLAIAREGDNKGKVVGKLLIAWGMLALFLVGSAAVGLHFQGATAITLIFVALAFLGGVLWWLFRRPVGT